MKFIGFACSISALGSALLLGLAACAPASEPPPAPEPPVATAAPAIVPIPAGADVKPFSIGEFQAAALRDGGLSVPNDSKTFGVGKTKADVDTVLTANSLPTDMIELSVEPMVVKTTDKVLLFDTGAAALFGPTLGKLSASLASAGIEPGSVADIFISHAHGDHVGGLVTADGALAFPNAAIHMSANEWAALKGNARMAALVTVITPKVVEFQPGADIVPGVKAVDIQGHTPGHSGYLITSGDQSLLYVGDAVHHSIISVQQPDWPVSFDGDGPTAQASRKSVLESSATAGQRIYAVHFPFPGVGKFEKKDAGYVWVAQQ